jgi:hypothetical protein
VPRLALTVHVRIEGETKQKPSDVHVEFEGSEGYLDHNGVDAEGRVTLRAVDRDVYHVRAVAPDSYLKLMQWGTAELTNGELDLTSGAVPESGLVIVMGADGGEISGVVRNEKEEPVAAEVTLVPISGSKPAYRSFRAEADGRFRLTAVAPGRYRLWAWDDVNQFAVMYDPDFLTPFANSAVDVEVQARDRRSQDLRLTVNR